MTTLTTTAPRETMRRRETWLIANCSLDPGTLGRALGGTLGESG